MIAGYDMKFKGPEQARNKLEEQLQKALMLELSTIPAYATACYSIQEQGQYNRCSPEIINAQPIEVMRQVMVEEMLHMTLISNLINAIGGSPCLTNPALLPSYPYKLFEHSDFRLHLRCFTPEQVKAFRTLERAPSEEDMNRAATGDYRTIAGFYHYVTFLLDAACDQFNEEKIFIGDIDRQINNTHYHSAGGKVIIVNNLKTAIQAIEQVVNEGEGALLGEKAGDGDDIPSPEGHVKEDVAHYFKFDGILHSRYYRPTDQLGAPPTGQDMVVTWKAVLPMKDDPKSSSYNDIPEIQSMSEQFNQTYSDMLNQLEYAFNGSTDQLLELIPVMYRLKVDAQRLMRVPLPGGSGETAGPTWEYIGKAVQEPS